MAKTEYNYLEIDIRGSEAGRYELEVAVTDLNAGTKADQGCDLFDRRIDEL